MNRVTAGSPISFVYDVASAGNSHTATVTDATGRYLRATATTSDPNVTVGVSAGEWPNGQEGYGRIEIADESGVIVKRDRFRILAGAKARQGVDDYRDDYGRGY